MTGFCHCKHQAQRLVLNSIQGSSVISFQGKFTTVSNKDLNRIKLRLSLQVTIVAAQRYNGSVLSELLNRANPKKVIQYTGFVQLRENLENQGIF